MPDSDIKKSEIGTYDGDDSDRPEYGALWDEEHYTRLLNYGPEAAFERLVDTHASGSVLVLGCGEGENAHRIAAREETSSVCGIEISKSRLKKANQSNTSASFMRADAEQLPFQSNTFDTVVAHSILHHLPNWRLTGLQEIKRVLRDSGVLLFYEPGRYNPPAALRRTFYPSNIHTPDEQPFDSVEFNSALREHFSQIEMEGHCMFSNVLPVVDGQLPISVPFALTRALYDFERILFDSVGNRFAWVLTGFARL